MVRLEESRRPSGFVAPGSPWSAAPLVATCVVGAGPAGLLFALTMGIRYRRWRFGQRCPILLVDKRATYERTHRLRIDSAPYLALQQQLDDSLFDELIDYLEAEGFRPAANQLEARLLDLVDKLGIEKRLLEIGNGAGQVDLAELRAMMIRMGIVRPGTQVTVVGADSVRSAVRDMALDGGSPMVERTHQTVARLRVTGTDLPKKLSPVRQVKLSKLLGSAVDYRLNQNGFAEIDLFLSGAEHRFIEGLGATPANRVVVDDALLANEAVPLFASVIGYVRSEIGASVDEVTVQSTFRLEHRYAKRVAIGRDDLGLTVFLVGDAAVSLPFFRGMACLAQCVDQLAKVHLELASTSGRRYGKPGLDRAVDQYNAAVRGVRRTEVRKVERRARGLRVAREAVRVSSMAPFPIQSWLLSVRSQSPARGWFSGRFLLTVVLLVLAAASTIAVPMLGSVGFAGVAFQLLAGFAYRRDLRSRSRPNPWVRRACLVQMSFLMVGGVFVAVADPYASSPVIRLGALVGWFVLGLVFVLGMYLAELRNPEAFPQAETP